MTLGLDTAFLDDGIRTTNFFNGRLLSGEDLRQEQEARDEALQRLGRALGDGIAYGLEVAGVAGSRSPPTVTVQPGLAINRKGEALQTRTRLEVALSAPRAAATGTAQPGSFGVCSLPASDYVAGDGVYLLALSPAGGREGKAKKSGLSGLEDSCDAKRLVEGVQFRLLRLDVADGDLLDEAHLRSRAAQLCLGGADPHLSQYAANPLTLPDPYRSYGLVDALRPDRLGEGDVPLAILHWTDAGGLDWVDRWAVRRRLVREPGPQPFAPFLGDRRAAEAEAAFYQFRDHAAELGRGAPETVRALDHFRFLPPAAVLPMGDIQGATGFSLARFFDGLKTRASPAVIEGARAALLLRSALCLPPITLHEGAAWSQELIWIYLVRENQAALRAGGPQPYFLFASGHQPYLGAAVLDVARAGFSNLALR